MLTRNETTESVCMSAWSKTTSNWLSAEHVRRTNTANCGKLKIAILTSHHIVNAPDFWMHSLSLSLELAFGDCSQSGDEISRNQRSVTAIQSKVEITLNTSANFIGKMQISISTLCMGIVSCVAIYFIEMCLHLQINFIFEHTCCTVLYRQTQKRKAGKSIMRGEKANILIRFSACVLAFETAKHTHMMRGKFSGYKGTLTANKVFWVSSNSHEQID